MEDLSEMIRRVHEAADGKTDAERRNAPRLARQGAISIRVAGADSSSKSISVRFRDCSASGIGFSSSSPLPAGTNIETVVKHPDRGDLIFRYEVVRCLRVNKNLFTIGAKLIR
ncbi:MAG TPA: PilZ domain-containing protein [Tepidisphaeraceae bacterium]|nr:PilZ domain-containing protein [Tepidisphaeraceae bacterium]